MSKTFFFRTIDFASVQLDSVFRFRFAVHRNILVAASPYFQALLGPNYKEANEKEVVLSDIDGKTLKAIIGFCYTGHIEITAENIDDTMAAASSKELVYLEKMCSQFCCVNLNANNCLSVLLIAEKYHLNDLSQTSLRYICENFIDIPIKDMMEIDEKILETILKQNQINAAEIFIFECFMQWVQHEDANRSVHVAALASLIRLEHIPGEVSKTNLNFVFIALINRICSVADRDR